MPASSQEAGTTLTIATGDTLTLTGAATLAGTVNGAGTVKLSNATLSGLTIGGTATLSDVGTVDQTGAVTIGDASSNAATLSIGVGATYRIDNDSGIARGTSHASSIKNSGLLIKSGGTGTSKIGVKTTDTGAIEAASGTLDFTKAITGGGTMAVDTGATLEVDRFGGGDARHDLQRRQCDPGAGQAGEVRGDDQRLRRHRHHRSVEDAGHRRHPQGPATPW